MIFVTVRSVHVSLELVGINGISASVTTLTLMLTDAGKLFIKLEVIGLALCLGIISCFVLLFVQLSRAIYIPK